MNLTGGCRSALHDLTVDTLRLHWSRTGQGPKTVIFVHGWTCDETIWRAQARELAQDYQVITMDLPGHGRSQGPVDGKFSIDLFARAVESVRLETRAERVALVGHSLGTQMVLRYARLYPGHTAALVLVEGVISQPRMLTLASRQLTRPGGKQAFEMIIRSTLFSSATTPALRTHILSMMLGAPDATVIGVVHAMQDPAAWSDDVVNLPVLGIYQEKSRFAQREVMKTRFPALEYVEMPDAGHFLMMEKPREFNRRLQEFLDKQAF
jgi:sigma-B regulation protein RsbQ